MKYIRTKDGRIIKPYKYADYKHAYYYFGKDNVWNFCENGDVLNQADTIEELCDRVVVKDFNNKEPRIYNPNKCNWKEIADTLFNARKVEWVKFAIWTDKGLIYVAKMNEKGVLELL